MHRESEQFGIPPLTTFPFWVVLLAALPAVTVLVAMPFNEPLGIALSCIFLIGCISFGWGNLVEAPSPVVTATVMFAMGLVNLVLLSIFKDFSWCLVTAFLTLIASFIGEILRGARRNRVVWSLAASVTGSINTICASTWVLYVNYPVMTVLTWAFLPSMLAALLSLFYSCSKPVTRLTFSVAVALIVQIPILLFYVPNYPQLAAMLPFPHLDATLRLWILGIMLGFLSGLSVAVTTMLFIVSPQSRQNWYKFSLLLLPTVFAGVPLYALARIIGG